MCEETVWMVYERYYDIVDCVTFTDTIAVCASEEKANDIVKKRGATDHTIFIKEVELNVLIEGYN